MLTRLADQIGERDAASIRWPKQTHPSRENKAVAIDAAAIMPAAHDVLGVGDDRSRPGRVRAEAETLQETAATRIVGVEQVERRRFIVAPSELCRVEAKF